MNVSMEDKKAEAVERMVLWGIFPETVRQFEKDGLISESIPPVGACFWVEGEQLERIRKFEEEHNALVYFVIHSYTNIGELENYLFVSDYSEEWEEYDRAGIKKRRAAGLRVQSQYAGLFRNGDNRNRDYACFRIKEDVVMVGLLVYVALGIIDARIFGYRGPLDVALWPVAVAVCVWKALTKKGG